MRAKQPLVENRNPITNPKENVLVTNFSMGYHNARTVAKAMRKVVSQAKAKTRTAKLSRKQAVITHSELQQTEDDERHKQTGKGRPLREL